MSLLKRIEKPALLLPYKQLFIQAYYNNNIFIPEQRTGDHNPMFQFLFDAYVTSPT
jgi:hypothetical protein